VICLSSIVFVVTEKYRTLRENLSSTIDHVLAVMTLPKTTEYRTLGRIWSLIFVSVYDCLSFVVLKSI
jgi:hypothetical protein